MLAIDSVLDDVTLQRPDGTPVALRELVTGPTVVQVLRYYG